MADTAPLLATGDAAPATAEAPIRLRLHRSATLAARGASPVRLERKQAALLAYLQHTGGASRSRLAGLLWPASTTSTSRNNLRQCLARLRRIAPGLLVEQAEVVVLAPSVEVAPADDGRAELLEDYEYADCDDFARWLQARVDDERSARQAGLMAALAAATRRGDFVEAQARADALLALDRESEDPYRALMEVAYRRGDFAAAVRIWDRCREMLRQLYGVSPSSATQALGEAVLAAAPSAQRPGAAAPAVAGRPAVGAEVLDPAATPRRFPNNLEAYPPTLFGRADELSALLTTLHTHRLVTLVGIGGIGKTSLALAAAHAERERWSEGVWFADLSPVSAPEHLVGAVARALGVSLPADSVADLVRLLRSGTRLLLLDNAEHLWEAVAALAAALLAGTQDLRLLVTSRRALRVAGEQRFRLAGLSAPADFDAADHQRSDALALFEARAAALQPRFRLTALNAPAVAEICRRLDGLPLAIELAAARVPLLGVTELQTRLRQSVRVLGASATGGAPRQQTLRATFDWTHALLTPPEQQLLRRLAVFVGGFTLGLAERISAPDAAEPGAAAAPDDRDAGRLLDELGGLIDKSLLIASDGEPRRYRLLEVTRAYALEKLADAGEFDRLSRRHAEAVWRLFAGAENDLNEKIDGVLSRGQFLRRLTPELDNLRAARQWSRSSAGDRVLCIGLAGASIEALRLLGLSTEALRVTLELCEFVDERVPLESAELFWTGLCALGTHGRLPKPEILAVIDKAERAYRRVGSPRRIHVGLYRKGFALLHLGSIQDAQRAVAEMASLEQPGWPARAVAIRLNLQGAVDAFLGRFEASISAFSSAATLLRFQPDERDVVLNLLSNLCMSLLGAERHEEALATANDVLASDPSPVVRNIARRATLVALTFLGRLDDAATLAREAMNAWRSDDMLPHMLSVFAWLAYLQGRLADAVRLDGAARAQLARVGLSNTPVFDRARSHLAQAIATRAVSSVEVARWRREGEQLSQDEVVASCLGGRPADGMPAAA